jgi:RNA polymerase sigma factor (sigma-70 family)
LFVITRNVVLNAQRTISRRHEIELLSPHLVESSDQIGSALLSGSHPVDQIIRQEIQQAVSGAIHKLPERQRQAIELVGLDGCRYKVAAKQMKMTEKAIKSLVHRAKVNLRVMLETEYPSHVA